MTRFRLALAAGLAAFLACADVAQADPQALTVDAEAMVAGVPVACTGIGQTRLDPKWQAYGVRVEFSNPRAEYLGDGAITVRDHKGAEVLSIACDAPWILMKLPPGRYTVEGRVKGLSATRSAQVSPPASGQTRVVLRFPDA